MRVTFELDDNEEGAFDKAEFRMHTDVKGIYEHMCQQLNQFLYPFVNPDSRIDMAKIVSDLAKGEDQDSFVRILNLMQWDKHDLECLSLAIKKEIEERATDGSKQAEAGK